jgi:hypothetical protein
MKLRTMQLRCGVGLLGGWRQGAHDHHVSLAVVVSVLR